MTPKRPRQHQKAQKTAQKHIAATSPVNRPMLLVMQDDLLNRHRSWNTIEAYCRILRLLDHHLGGRRFDGATA